MQKLLILTEEISQESEKNGFFHGAVLDILSKYNVTNIFCLRKGVNNLETKISITVLNSKSRLNKILNLLRLIIAKRSEYEEVLVHRNPEYILLCGIFWKLMGKKIKFYYSHKNVNFALKFANFISDEIYTQSSHSYPLKTAKLKIIGDVSQV
jgi:hypothetical protein